MPGAKEQIAQLVRDLEELAELGLVDEDVSDADAALGELIEVYVTRLNEGHTPIHEFLIEGQNIPKGLRLEARRLLKMVDLLRGTKTQMEALQ